MSTVESSSPLPLFTTTTSNHHHPSHTPTLPPSPPPNHFPTNDKQAPAPLLLPSPSLSPPSSPASEDLSETDLDFSSHAALFEALFSTPGSAPITPASLNVAPSSLPSSRPSNPSSSSLPSSTRKRKAESTLDSMDAKARDRVLRNRAAAQESRDKKRRYITELEGANLELRSENERLAKRLKTVEEEKDLLAARLDSLSTQLSQIQQHLGLGSVTQLLFDGFRDPAAVTNMPGLANARGGDGAPNDNRGNDDRHDGALPRVTRGLASSQQRKPSSQQRIQLQKPCPSNDNDNTTNINQTSSSPSLPHLLRLPSFPRFSTSTSTSSHSTHEISWPLAVWMTLSILLWITTAPWTLGRAWRPSLVRIPSLSERRKVPGYLGPLVWNDRPP